MHCIVVEDEVQTPLILIRCPKWGDHPHFSWYKVSYFLQLSGLYSTEGRRQTGIRRCQGTCPSFPAPWLPSNHPCRHVMSLQTRGHLTSQTTVLGNYPDGSLNEKKDIVLGSRFTGSWHEWEEVAEPWEHALLKWSYGDISSFLLLQTHPWQHENKIKKQIKTHLAWDIWRTTRSTKKKF